MTGCVGRALLAAACLGATAAHAQSCSAVSGPRRAALVELYTSEGCSSCPPADRQLGLVGAPVNGNVVALALHVNFWDHIGWKDPFARAEFTERQRWLVGANGGRTLYTPHFFVGGAEVGDRSRLGEAIRQASSRPAGAVVRINVSRAADASLALRASAADVPPKGQPVLHAAVTENGLSTRVTAGENRGATLAHDHVVRHWFKPVAFLAGAAEMAQSVTLSPEQAKKGVAVVAFVQDTRTGEVLQAVTTGVCRAG
ncbi:MAG: DUF1223 domain-containing protein [Burkholderiales bacterium]|nr:DUF1223 domain-containing protein [Burkholderiales bacterium]